MVEPCATAAAVPTKLATVDCCSIHGALRHFYSRAQWFSLVEHKQTINPRFLPKDDSCQEDHKKMKEKVTERDAVQKTLCIGQV
jgi:hypothetical protein